MNPLLGCYRPHPLIAIYCYYSPQNILILQSRGGQKVESTWARYMMHDWALY